MPFASEFFIESLCFGWSRVFPFATKNCTAYQWLIDIWYPSFCLPLGPLPQVTQICRSSSGLTPWGHGSFKNQLETVMSVPYVAYNCSLGGLLATVVTLLSCTLAPSHTRVSWADPYTSSLCLVLSPDFVCDFITVIQPMDSMVASHPAEPLVFQRF